MEKLSYAESNQENSEALKMEIDEVSLQTHQEMFDTIDPDTAMMYIETAAKSLQDEEACFTDLHDVQQKMSLLAVQSYLFGGSREDLITGEMNETTQAMIRAFQEDFDLAATGELDRETILKMAESKFQTPEQIDEEEAIRQKAEEAEKESQARIAKAKENIDNQENIEIDLATDEELTEVIQYAANQGKIDKVTTLFVRKDITDIKPALDLKKLQTVYFQQMDAGKLDIEDLKKLDGLPDLRYIWMDKHRITEENAKKIEEKINTYIDWI